MPILIAPILTALCGVIAGLTRQGRGPGAQMSFGSLNDPHIPSILYVCILSSSSTVQTADYTCSFIIFHFELQ